MRTIEEQFSYNANQTGVQSFERVCQQQTPTGHNAYIYKRVLPDGRIFGFEVFVPSVKKAGTYPLPNGKSISYEEDFEEYPGAAKFGRSAWACITEERARVRLADLVKALPVALVESPEEEKESVTAPVSNGRGRPRGERPVLSMPEGEFSCKELAEKNGVEYVTAFVFLKEAEEAGTVKRTRTERRAARGKPTQLFEKLS